MGVQLHASIVGSIGRAGDLEVQSTPVECFELGYSLALCNL